MRLPNICGLLTASALLIGANSANALVLTLEALDNNGTLVDTVIVDDQGVNDGDSGVGSLFFNGVVGSFTVNLTTAQGDAIEGLGNDAISGNFLSYLTRNDGTLDIDGPDDDLTTGGDVTSLRMTLLEENISIVTDGLDGAARFSAELDPNVIAGITSVQTFFSVNDGTMNGIDASATLIAEDLLRTDSTGADVTGSVTAALLSSDTFDLQTVVLVTHDGKFDQSQGQVRIAVSAVPLPAALPLFLTALLGLGFVGRHRRRQAA